MIILFAPCDTYPRTFELIMPEYYLDKIKLLGFTMVIVDSNSEEPLDKLDYCFRKGRKTYHKLTLPHQNDMYSVHNNVAEYFKREVEKIIND